MRAWPALAATAVLALAACGGPERSDPSSTRTPGAAQSDSSAASTGRAPATPARSVDYLPGRAADVYPAASGDGSAPVVVLVPGGSWQSARHEGLRPLAAHLSAAGSTVVTATYGTSRTGTYYPEPVAEVGCAVAFAVSQAGPEGGPTQPPGPVVVVGHSAGAVIAALVALTPPAPHPDCPHPPVEADAFVGLAGPYDVSAFAPVATSFFGVPPGEAPATWDAGNPVSQADRRPQVPVLLVHGQSDAVVPPQAAGDFAQRLEAAGHDVRVELLTDADHLDVLGPGVTGDLLAGWLAGLD